MVRYNLINQEEFLDRAALGMGVELVIPIKFANGYFVKGFSDKMRDVYATIRPDNGDQLQRYLDRTRHNKKQTNEVK